MGALRQTFRSIEPVVSSILPVKAQQVATSFPLQPPISNPAPRENYEQFAREGYMGNDLVFQCVDMLCTSAAEPNLAVYRYPGGDEDKKEPIPRHELLTLLKRPNPFMTEYQLVAGIRMYRSIAGNAYLLKVRSKARKVVQLWPLRPDWVRVIPDPKNYISHYTYAPFGAPIPIPVEDIIHFKNRHPLDAYYGLPPLAPVAGRVDIDNWMRNLVAAFFKNGGVPIGMLTIKRALERGEKELIQQKFRRDFGGPSGWFNIALLDGTDDNEVTYTPMGMPLGERGLAMPDLNHISEERIAGCFGVPTSLLGTVSGRGSSSYANRVADQTAFWHDTLSPLYREDGDALTMGLQPDFSDVDAIGFDLSGVRALQEDEDKKSTRLLEQLRNRAITVEEFRREMGRDPEPVKGETWIVMTNVLPAPVGEDLAPRVPETPTPEEQAAADQAARDARAADEQAAQQRTKAVDGLATKDDTSKLVAAGLAVIAADTGRVLMLQRAIDANDPASGMWEFPGGHVEDGEWPWDAARREWQEETGHVLPPGMLTGDWVSPNGVYQCFVYQVSSEQDVALNLDPEDRHVLNPDDPDGDQIEVVAWWDPEKLPRNPAVRPELRRGTDWALLTVKQTDVVNGHTREPVPAR